MLINRVCTFLGSAINSQLKLYNCCITLFTIIEIFDKILYAYAQMQPPGISGIPDKSEPNIVLLTYLTAV